MRLDLVVVDDLSEKETLIFSWDQEVEYWEPLLGFVFNILCKAHECACSIAGYL